MEQFKMWTRGRPGTIKLMLRYIGAATFVMTTLLSAATPPPPTAKPQPKELPLHGDKRIDNYFWLREKTNPDVIAYLNAENAHTEAVMKPSEALQQKLYSEILGRIKQDDSTVPVREGNYFYYTRTEK